MTHWFQRFNRIWLVESVRRYEVEHGVQHHERIQTIAREQPTLAERIIVRAELLAPELGLGCSAQQWQQLYRLVWGVLLVLAIVSAIAIVRSALAIPQPISLSYALLVLLGLQFAMFVLWLVSLTTKAHMGAVGRLLLWLYRHIGRNPDRQQLQNQFISVINQYGLTTPLTSLLSHGYWLLVMVAVWLLLALHLSTNAYHFTWATTILAPETLQLLVDSIHWLPQQLGVIAPSVEQLWSAPDANLQLTAGRWLLSCVFWYGVAWRALCWLLSLLVLMKKLANVQVDTKLPGFAAVIRLLENKAAARVVDADMSPPTSVTNKTMGAAYGHGEMVLSLDYEADQEWLMRHAQQPDYAGVIASHQDKQQLLHRLGEHPVARITVRINTQLSPDRAALRFLQQLRQVTQHLQVQLVQPSTADGVRMQHWQEQLNAEAIAWNH